MRYQTIYIIIIILFTSININAQKLKFESYNTDDGLSVGTIWSLVQDKQGFIWFGTANGLNKFDGCSFEAYKHQEKKPNSLTDNNIYTLVCDDSGKIWIGTARGLNIFDPEENQFTKLQLNDTSCLKSEIIVKSLAIDSSQTLWIGTQYSGIFSYSLKNKCIKNYNLEIFNDTSNNIYVHDIIVDSKNNIWIGTENKGLFQYFPSCKKAISHWNTNTYSQETKNSCNNINTIFEDSKGRLWIGTYRTGIFLFDIKTSNFKHIGKYYSDNKQRLRNRINRFSEDKYGTIWIATYAGLSYINEKVNEPTYYYTPSKEMMNQINSNRILSLLKDNAGSLWIGTYDNGVNVLHNTKPKFKHYQKELNNPTGLNDDIVLTFAKDNYGSLLIGTFKGGLSLFDRKKENFFHYKNQNPDLGGSVLNIYSDNDGIIWFGTWGSGLNKFDRKNNTIKKFIKNENKNSIANNTILHIANQNKHIIWLATYSGLNKFNEQTNRFKLYTINDGLLSNIIYYIKPINNDTLLIGTKDGGFSIFNTKTEKIENFVHSANDSTSISNNVIYYIHVDEDNKYWIATENGLNKFDVKTKKFKSFTEDDGLPNNKIYAILEDQNHYLWLSSDKGLCKFKDTRDETGDIFIRTFDVNDGLQGNEFTQGGSFYDKNTNEMFFGGTNGFNSFCPSDIKDNSHIPPVYITSFKIFDKEVKLDTSISMKKSIEISWRKNFLSFEFVGLDYLNPSKNLYSYKMQGLDKQWSSPSSRRYAAYPGISHGEYTFMVKATNNDGLWSNKFATFHIIIKPPFWKTNWFIFLSILVGFIGIILFIRIRTYRLEQEKRVLEEKVAQRTQELKQKNQDITASITYAKRIQEAILPKITDFDKAFVDTFVLYKPKDIVSGDFFWYAEKDNTRIFAAADCTGHGVPGAFMSIIGNNMLEKVISQYKNNSSGDILKNLNECVKEALHQEGKKGDTFDGMDMALCCIDYDSNILKYSGAYRPLILIRNEEAIQYKASKYAIGGSQLTQEKIFDTHEIKVQPGDKIYIFSDGFVDQFGGNKNRKFMLKNFIKELMKINKLPMLEQEIILEEIIERWMNDYEIKAPQIDDILVVGVEF